ncbi:hypothetical protein R1sor_011210 [Riccia sorocarpa]|uniref:Uncharacterized protein n=1 Tax=Riccia sorocarpa TaxID=122646 RepID=A0ABD3I224_9MARC
MEDHVHLSFKDTDDTEKIPCTDGTVVVDETFFQARWDMCPKSVYISERVVFDGETHNFLVSRSGDSHKTLISGKRYVVRGIVDTLATEGVRSGFKSPEPRPGSSVHPSIVDEAGSSSATTIGWEGIPDDPALLSTFLALRQMRGRSISQNDTHRHDKVARTQQAIRYVRGKLVFGPELDICPQRTPSSVPATPAGLSPGSHSTRMEGIPLDNRSQCTPSSVPATPAGLSPGSRSTRMEGAPIKIHMQCTPSSVPATPVGLTSDSRPTRMEGAPLNIHTQCTPSSVPATAAGMPQRARSQRMEGIPPIPFHHREPADVAGTLIADRPEPRRTLEKSIPVNNSGSALHDGGNSKRPEIPAAPVENPNSPTAHGASVVTISTESDTAPFEQAEDSSNVEIIESMPRRRPPTRSRLVFQQFQHQIDVPSQFGIPIVEVDVDRGTGLTSDEIDFLTTNGFVLVSRPGVGLTETNVFPSEAELKILLDAYPEQVHEFPHYHRFRSRGGRGYRQKITPSDTASGVWREHDLSQCVSFVLGK